MCTYSNDIICENCIHLKVCSRALPPYTMSCEEWLSKKVGEKKIHVFTDGLLPCPFCGGKARLVKKFSIVGDNVYWIECSDCSGMVGRMTRSGDSNRTNFWSHFETIEEAIKNWNTRCGIEIQDTTTDRVIPKLVLEP